MHLLAADVGDVASNAIVPTLILLAIVAVLIGVIAVIRRNMFRNDSLEKDPLAGFSLGSLRQLVREGKMTQEEYEKAKAQLVQAAQRQVEKNAPPPAELSPEPKPRVDELR